MSRSEGNFPESRWPQGRRSAELLQPPSEAAASAPISEAPGSQLRQTRAFVRAFSATNYLLGKRGSALVEGLTLADPQAREIATEVTEQLSHGVQAQRARALAAEVGRLMRSLSTQRLK